MQLMKKFADSRVPDSYANRMRLRRFGLFRVLMSSIPRPARILDVGGTEQYWEMMRFSDERDIAITLLNLEEIPVRRSSFRSLVGDARCMSQFQDQEFDVVFSNAVIEHVGEYSEQERLASEIRRVGRRYFVQAPNRYFPIEMHFMLPLFQFYPLLVRTWLLTNFEIGWHPSRGDRDLSRQIAQSVHLPTRRELERMFPGGAIQAEKLFGFTKSFIIWDGWSESQVGREAAHRRLRGASG